MQIGVHGVSLLTFTFSPAWIAILKDESRMWSQPVLRRQTRRRGRRSNDDNDDDDDGEKLVMEKRYYPYLRSSLPGLQPVATESLRTRELLVRDGCVCVLVRLWPVCLQSPGDSRKL